MVRLRSKSTTVESNVFYQWENPRIVYDRFGHSVDTIGNAWELTDPSLTEVLNWNLIRVEDSLLNSFKCYIAYCIEVKAARTARNTFYYFLESINKSYEYWRYPLQMDDLLGILDFFRSKRTEHKFHWIRKWYTWCADVEIPGFYQEISEELLDIKVAGNEKGVAVLIDDDEEGPLDNIEYDLLRSVVKKEVGTLLERVCIMLCMELGYNPKNLVLIEKRDFKKNIFNDDQIYYSLNVPRIKKRLASRVVRSRKISKRLGKFIDELIHSNSKYDSNYGDKCPVLYSRNKRYFASSSMKRFEHHMVTSEFTQLIVNYAKKAKIVSPRTGDILHLTPRRLRYTFATRLVEQGASPSVVAEALDHTDLQNVGVYFKARGQIVGDLDKALDSNPHYKDIINKFQGIVLERDQTSGIPTIPGQISIYKSLGGIGGCGSKSLCKFYPPLSCYLCPSFQAWRDGPHKEVLAELKELARRVAASSGYPVARIKNQVDDVIVAISQLITKIECMEES
ncbi:tyrosine-type recombinase/integrase [Desulfovibrio gilichinskyi]|uniref:Phage integrase family protein n=1 Tax=Desulfovibrio gilichinskyi TaxID=1519643 RepID=A0A1X7DSK9_9BACT|nr:tyrosine-type recombinase/integrase [Desulfovibrio gilichinskyi]SMF20783.1 Phage integrase family protein [Desulfovibrio gilichinskyi]